MRLKYSPIIYYAAPGAPVGGGTPAAPQSTRVEPGSTPAPQPGGQEGGQGDGFRSQYFPNVPDEVWSQVEPHVRGVQGHVTQLEQRYAPFKSYRDQDLQGLSEFAASFDRDPVGQWIRMAQGMQQAGILDENLDVEHLALLAAGQDPDAEPAPVPPSQQQDGDVPPWAQQLMGRLDRLEGGVTKFQTDNRRQVEDAVLKRQVELIQTKMKEGGIPEGTISDELVLATYISHRGNANAAAETLVNTRNALLKGYVQGPDPTPEPGGKPKNNDLDLPEGAPPTRAKRQGRVQRGVIPNDVKAAAEQYLRKSGS